METARSLRRDKTAKAETVVKEMVRIAEAWRLTNAEAARLFDVPTATWSRMKNGTFKGILDQDKVTQASLLIGLFKGLRSSSTVRSPMAGQKYLIPASDPRVDRR